MPRTKLAQFEHLFCWYFHVFGSKDFNKHTHTMNH